MGSSATSMLICRYLKQHFLIQFLFANSYSNSYTYNINKRLKKYAFEPSFSLYLRKKM